MSKFDLLGQDTICAPATAPAPAALAIIRVSGPNADAVLGRVFRRRKGDGLPRPLVATLGDVVDDRGALIDEALCHRFEHGRSYTGDKSFELSIHGGPTRVSSTVRALVAAGCRLAEPGEFTLRAVLNGRMDLTAAEAVHDVVSAKSDAAARASLRALHGGIRQATTPVRTAIVDALAELEARMDYPDEDLGDASRAEIAESLAKAAEALNTLLDTADRGRKLTEGARVVLYGPPNAGKSTLLNALVGQERALVHNVPGTTRDVLEAESTFGGVPCVLVDVAGIREVGAGEVEALGIARAKGELDRADVVVRLHPLGDPTARTPLPDHLDAHVIEVASKSDLAEAPHGVDDVLSISAASGAGMEALKEALERALGSDGTVDDGALLTRARQVEEVAEAKAALDAAKEALLSGAPDEIVASELRRAGRALDRLLGQVLEGELGEDVLDAVFSRFCIGK